MNIDAFDFDGTLIKGDSIRLFSRWVCNSKFEFYILYYSYISLFNIFFNIKYQRAFFFFNLMKKRNKNIQEFNDLLFENLFDDSLNLLKSTKNKKVIVSASFSEIIGNFCQEKLGVTLIANSFKEKEKDVNYDQKVISLNEYFNEDFLIINAYGNSEGDYSLLKTAKNSFYRNQNGNIIKWDK